MMYKKQNSAENPELESLKYLVFKTDIRDERELNVISQSIEDIPGIIEWSVDLEDWEKVLRVVGTGIHSRQIIVILRSLNVNILEMPV